MNEIIEKTYNQMIKDYEENNIYRPQLIKSINFLNEFDIVLNNYLTGEFGNKDLLLPRLAYSFPEENECDINWNFDHVGIGFSFDENNNKDNNDCWYIVTDGTIDGTNSQGYFRDYTTYSNVIDFVINYVLNLCDKKLINPSRI